MQALVIKADNDLRAQIAFLLESELKVTVKEAISLQDGLANLLDDSNQFDIIICDDSAENLKIFKYLMTSDVQVKCLVLKDPKVQSVLAFPDLIAGYVNPNKVADEIRALFNDKIGKTKAAQKEGVDADYCRIRGLMAVKDSPLPCDLYLRLSAIKYLKIFNKGDDQSGKDMAAFFKNKNIEYLYMLNSDASLFANRIKDNMEKAFKAAQTPEAATRVATSIHETVAELGGKLGFTPEVQALARQGMLMTIKAVGSGNSMLANIFRSIAADKDNYLGSHAILTAQLSCALATMLKWSSETTFQKLTFAAFFHDIAITNQTLAQISTIAELDTRQGEFTEDEIKKFKNHASIAVQVTSKFKEVPTDVDTIITQHHERPDGSGFPRGLTAENIAPLSLIFIIAHDLVNHVFFHGTEGIDKFLVEYKAKYPTGKFSKMLAQIDLGSMGLGSGK